MGQPNYATAFELALHPHALGLPLTWKKPQTIFVNSMSDLFIEGIPIDFIRRVFDVMNQAHWHTFQILTKRSERLAELSRELPWSPNIWMGVSVENDDYAYRINHLRSTGAAVKFLSMEPLLGPASNINLQGIDWVIVGGESGPGSRPMKEEWVVGIKEQCIRAKVPFFFKQWGGIHKKKAGRVLQGMTWDQMPQANHYQRESQRVMFDI
jgi:protein gp37